MAIKQGAQAKSRLAGLLDLPTRTMLADAMAHHVVSCLHAVDAIDDIRLLSPAPVMAGMTTWMPDGGAGLNTELERACAALPPRPLLVIHADLPFLAVVDLEELLASASRSGVAIAPDRHGGGTNALALNTSRPCRFAFGPDSLARHRLLWPRAAIVQRRGLAFDLDTPEDFAEIDGGGVLPAFACG
ncbi:2-phospho-L-lactate guanylyltransferase [Novosphingobium sp. BL-52-GroH]|uniref:2-phospho-L-lactate guanylyltransferase n=1 Tax=Novosphingobium sp. BL-52-GroH TaxID=3349877 RepID=UPI00384BB6C6